MPRLTEEKRYQVEVVNAYLTEAKSGTVGIAIDFKCPEGTIDHVLWATPNTIDRTWETLELLGYTKKHAEEMDNLDRIGEIINGACCSIECKNETYQGEEKLKVKWINPSGAKKSAAVETKSRLHALLNGNSITGLMSAHRSARPASEPPPNSPTPADSDVPF